EAALPGADRLSARPDPHPDHLPRADLVAEAAAGHPESEQCRPRRGLQPGADAGAPLVRRGRFGSRRAGRAVTRGDRQHGLAERMTSPVYVALDTPDLDKAKAIAARVKTHVGGLKLGLEFFAANGPAGVHEMARLGLPVFLDLKLHDIPNTVAKAVQALRPLEPAILTVHAAGGRAMMEDATAAAPHGTKVVGVTLLTSLDEAALRSIGVPGEADAQVERLALLAREAGLDGVVCSGAEIGTVRAAWPDAFIVVP